MVSPRKSRRKSLCFSKTITSTPTREQKAEHHSRQSAADNATACLYLFDSLSGLIHRWMFIHFT
jgi:hypothetical protein